MGEGTVTRTSPACPRNSDTVPRARRCYAYQNEPEDCNDSSRIYSNLCTPPARFSAMLWPIAQPALALFTGAGSPSGEALRRLSVAIPRPVEERQSPLVCDEWLWHSGEIRRSYCSPDRAPFAVTAMRIHPRHPGRPAYTTSGTSTRSISRRIPSGAKAVTRCARRYSFLDSTSGLTGRWP